MYFNKKVIFSQIKNGIIKHKKLFFVMIFWNVMCIYVATKNHMARYEFYGISASVADVLINLQEGLVFGLEILPLTVFLILKCKLDNMHTQFMIRYGDRTSMLSDGVTESIIYSIISSLLLVLLGILASCQYGLPFINWDSANSVLCMETGLLLAESFWHVVFRVLLMYIVKHMMFFVMIDILKWFPRYLFLNWISLMFVATLELPILKLQGIVGVHSLFSVQYVMWGENHKYAILLLAGIAIIYIEYWVGGHLIHKIDVFYE